MKTRRVSKALYEAAVTQGRAMDPTHVIGSDARCKGCGAGGAWLHRPCPEPVLQRGDASLAQFERKERARFDLEKAQRMGETFDAKLLDALRNAKKIAALVDSGAAVARLCGDMLIDPSRGERGRVLRTLEVSGAEVAPQVAQIGLDGSGRLLGLWQWHAQPRFVDVNRVKILNAIPGDRLRNRVVQRLKGEPLGDMLGVPSEAQWFLDFRPRHPDRWTIGRAPQVDEQRTVIEQMVVQ